MAIGHVLNLSSGLPSPWHVPPIDSIATAEMTKDTATDAEFLGSQEAFSTVQTRSPKVSRDTWLRLDTPKSHRCLHFGILECESPSHGRCCQSSSTLCALALRGFSCRPLKLDVVETFNTRMRLFIFPGAGDSVASWIQFVNQASLLLAMPDHTVNTGQATSQGCANSKESMPFCPDKTSSVFAAGGAYLDRYRHL